jgi:surfeit locus 1 family protein
MRIASFDFRPTLWPTLATLILLPFLAGLGIWQLERANWKQGLVDRHAERLLEPAVELLSLLPATPDSRYRTVTAGGRYDLAHQLLLDNRLHQGRAGYHVLTPLRLEGRDMTVLVNRGWLPVGASRAIRPELPGPAGEIRLLARVALPPEDVFMLDTVEESGTGWPQVVQSVDISAIEERLGYPLLPLVLQLDANDVHGFVRDWKPVYGIPPAKHRAYAMQWFTLALVLAMIYIGVNTRRIHRPGTGAGDEDRANE